MPLFSRPQVIAGHSATRAGLRFGADWHGAAVIPLDALRRGCAAFAGAGTQVARQGGRAHHAPAQSCQTRRTALTAAAPGARFL